MTYRTARLWQRSIHLIAQSLDDIGCTFMFHWWDSLNRKHKP
jgi:hypothetical protein